MFFSTIPLQVIAAEDAGCTEVAIVFLRGSGQNTQSLYTNEPFNTQTFGKVEKESSTFFNWFKYHLDNEYPHVSYKAISVHDFPGKYDPIGYRSVGIYPEIGNAANAEISAIPGDYRESVDHGINETVGYLKDQIASCPNQSIIVGGYSQGAQVMGESLFRLTQQERAKILGVGLFGDPKFIGSTDSRLNPFDKPESFPWRRGDAINSDSGMLDPRSPYLPSDIEKRSISYCMHLDIICAGWSGLRPNYRAVHGSYSGNAMLYTANEIMQWASPKLNAYEHINTGLDPNADIIAGSQPDTKVRDIMFMINDDSNYSVIDTFRYRLDPTLNPIAAIHPNTHFAAKAVGESDDGIFNVPRVENIQSFNNYIGYNAADPMFSVSNLATTINKRYPFGEPHYGSGDLANPLGLAVEKGVFAPGWRADSEKQIVLFTDRPLKDNYSFNICHDTTRTNLQIPRATYNVCVENIGMDTWPKSQQPEVCETIYLALTQDNCTNPIKQPGPIQMINRTLNDEITAAQSQKIAVDVVVPFNVRSKYQTQQAHDTAMQQLEYLAKATGGKFIYYDKYNQYDSTRLNDTLYQVFGHSPKPLVLAYKEALNNLDSFKTGSVLSVSTDQPVILDVSQTNQRFDTYKWDFNDDGQWDETSPGPVVQHEFTSPQNGFVRVEGVTSGGEQTDSRIALAASINPAPPTNPTLPTVPEVTATQSSDNLLTLNWQSGEEGTLLIIDPDSHLPIAQAPMQNGTTTFDAKQPYAQLEVRVAVNDVISDASLVQVQPEQTIPVIEDPIPGDQPPFEVTDPGSVSPAQGETPTSIQQDPDPTLCYKLQQCQHESAPPDSYNPQVVSLSSTEPTIQAPKTTTTRPTINPVSNAIDPQPAVQGVETTNSPTASNNAPLTQATLSQGSQKKYYLIVILIILGMMVILIRAKQNKLKRL